MKFFNRRTAVQKAYDERMKRWDAAMAEWEAAQEPVIIKFNGRLSEEDMAGVRRRFLSYYRRNGGRV